MRRIVRAIPKGVKRVDNYHGTDSKGATALVSVGDDGVTYAQYDDLKHPFAYGWHPTTETFTRDPELPKGTRRAPLVDDQPLTNHTGYNPDVRR